MTEPRLNQLAWRLIDLLDFGPDGTRPLFADEEAAAAGQPLDQFERWIERLREMAAGGLREAG